MEETKEETFCPFTKSACKEGVCQLWESGMSACSFWTIAHELKEIRAKMR